MICIFNSNWKVKNINVLSGKVGKWESSVFVVKEKNILVAKKNCENICIIRYYSVSLQHSCKTDKTQRNLRSYRVVNFS